jgi:bifunctional non-homologous end joining protein LigD
LLVLLTLSQSRISIENTADLALVIARRYPDRLTIEPQKRKCGKRLYLDTARNSYAQTAVAPYSVRAKAERASGSSPGMERA